MEAQTNPNDTARAQLAELIRTRREATGQTMQALGQALGLGRSTMHRMENRDASWPKGKNYATVLTALGVSEEELVEIVEQSPLREEVQRFMRPVSEVGGTLAYLSRERTTRQRPDLVVVTDDGSTLLIQVKGTADEGVQTVADALKAAGLIVSIPT